LSGAIETMKIRSAFQNSLARVTLLHMALRISVVVCVVTALAYLHLRQTLNEETAHQLRAYAEQRVARERSSFDLAAENGRKFRAEYLRRLAAFDPPDLEARFESLVQPWGDGTLRTRKDGFDQRTQVGIFIGPQQPIERRFQQRVVLAEELIDRAGALLTTRFPDLYLTMPGNVMVIYWPESAWVMEMAPDFDMRKEPYLTVADSQNNPRGEQAWTPVFYDSVSKVWMMSFATPIYVGGEHLASIEQDILLDDFLKRTASESLPGAHNVIFRKQDGTLIFAPGRTDDILEAAGRLTIAQTKDAGLDAIFRAASSAGKEPHLADLGDTLAQISFVPGPDWYFVTVYPKSLITSRALVAARVIFALGLCSLLLELLILYFVLKKSVASPLGALTRTTEALAAGDLSVRSDLERADEVGQLAGAFNQMAAAIQNRDEKLARHAEELEHKVDERTRALAQRTRDMRLVLDTVEQGFVTIDLDGTMARERSRIVEDWLGRPQGDSFVEYLRGSDPAAAEWLHVGLEAVREDVLPAELTLAQLPQRTRAGELVLGLGYVPIYGDAGEIQKLLLVLTDVTTRLERERLETEQREVVAIFQRVSQDAQGFGDFFSETSTLVEELRQTAIEHAHAMRLIHTVKGNTAFFGLTSMADVCHAVEEAVRDEGVLTDELVRRIEQAWAVVSAKVQTLLPEKREVIEISRPDYDELVSRVKAAAPPRSLLETLDSWTLEPVERRLIWLGGQARVMARRLDKGEIRVDLQSHGLRLEAQHWSSFWAVLVHTVRNALDHGIETADERRKLGKPELGFLRLETRIEQQQLVFAIEDDGRGIDWARVAARAKALGLAHATRSDLERALFAQGLSTKERATDISGRGVGMAAVYDDVRARGGSLHVSSTLGRGTSVECRVPLARLGSTTRFAGGKVRTAAE
jgi:HAMP domain-containing protein/HPt (histidine-containing phosphotransfer) domain-containing protein